MMQDKAKRWVNDVRNGKLHCRNVWFSLKFQLFPRIVYGLCSSTATFNDLGNALRKQYYQILPLGGGGPNHHHRESDNRFGFLWDRATPLGGRGTGGNVKQAAYALWVQYCNGAIHAGQPLAVSVGIGDILTAPPRILRKIQFSLDTLLDENAVGEDLYVWHQNDCCRRGMIPPVGGRPLPDADIFQEGLPAGDAPLTESGTDILPGVIRIRHSDSVWHQDRLRGPRPAPGTSQEITTVVANRTPDNVRFPDVGGMLLWRCAQVKILGRDSARSSRQRTGYGNGDGTRDPDTCANPTTTATQRTCSWLGKKQTGFTIWRHGHPQGRGSSAQWSPHSRGRSKADGD